MNPSPEDSMRSDLIAWLETKRRHVVQQVQAMPAEERRTSRLASGWTPLGLVHHLTMDVERVWFRLAMAGQSVDIPGGYAGWRAPADLSDVEIIEAYVEECRVATEAVESMALDQPMAWWFEDAGDPPYTCLREVLLHVLVETATHAGHLDIARELVDGGQRLVLDQPDDQGGSQTPGTTRRSRSAPSPRARSASW